MESTLKRARTCVGCGKQTDKLELLRVVRADGKASFDASGRASGRGAYACSLECLEKSFESRRLQRALKCGIERSEMDQIVADAQHASAQRR